MIRSIADGFSKRMQFSQFVADERQNKRVLGIKVPLNLTI